MKKQFLTLFLGFVALALHAAEPRVKFAVISDIHHDIAHDAPERLTDFLNAAQTNKVDFIIELGDFCFAKQSNESFLGLWTAYSGEKHNVLGNHDMDVCTKEEYMSFVGLEKRYYSFDKGGVHFVVLDPNNLFVDGEYIPYRNANFYVDASKRAFVDPEQLEWLKADLASTDKLCVIFSHQSLENTVRNKEQIQQILEAENERCGRQKVVASLSGHDHTSYATEINGIQYIQINSASNTWLGEEYACPERFSEEINTRRPALKNTAPYKDALYSIVTITPKGINIKGRQSTFISPTPTELKVPEPNKPQVPFNKNFTIKFIK